MKALFLLPAAILLAVGSGQAASIVTTGETVAGTTTSLSLSVGSTASDGDVDVSNDGSGNLVYAVRSTTANTDWWVQFNGLSIDPSIYTYAQIDFLSVTAGAEASRWQMYWNDGDSSIGGGSNSGTVLADPVALPSSPFSVVIDLTDGGTSTSGATGWGSTTPAPVTQWRLDMYESSTANRGETFVISGITLGSALVPEPSSLSLLALGGLLSLRRRRK